MPEEYYSTLFHELVHSTGHKKRLNRSSFAKVQKFGNREELIAEFGGSKNLISKCSCICFR
ncbi:zincin-like metallopeptidase domain-containing protein [Desulfoscipio gibsoniae]|uniref:zincin-like metallopeptidase domain-containing protein n=1 Tax=Desulfoscipio gibsoniae TaxID=102134 RepID=UPI001FE12607|nr:zincin-like metallopeptidase domain-containing protein [Desulfoscipio gibsoniae]